MRLNTGFLLLLIAAACQDRPSAKFGTADSMADSGTTRSISAKFSKADLEILYKHLNSTDFQKRLGAYTCAEPPPKLDFTVSILERAEYQERHVLIQPRPHPSPSGHERCLMFGLDYEISKEIEALDHGEPINYHYHDPHTGSELPPSVYKRPPPRAPVCDCSKRDSNEEWVN